MPTYYLAIDIGASSGRHMLGWIQEGKLKLEEIYRFPNELIRSENSLCWDYEALFAHIISGLKRCKELGKIPRSMGIDTWAVDFVLLNKEGKPLGKSVAYRDSRTQGMDEKVFAKISERELYERTGIQKLPFNTIYQLMSTKETLDEADSLLMVPEYFNFLLTGAKKAEYTNATSTQLVNAKTKDWDFELIEKLGYPSHIFQSIHAPGTTVGTFAEEISNQVGFDCEVVLPATHDTASAVMAMPTHSDAIFLSSGTWSLIGIERLEADGSELARAFNFTNEGGYEGRFRFLKNIMGLWMVQSLQKELLGKYSFSELCLLASKSPIAAIVDCQDPRFLAPDSMISAIQDYCREHQLPMPDSVGDLAAVIYNSLAHCYKTAVSELELISGKVYKDIHIIGGGSQADYLSELTAKLTGKTVFAGPVEATAIGNIGSQLIQMGEMPNLKAFRQLVSHSYEIKLFEGEQHHVKKAV